MCLFINELLFFCFLVGTTDFLIWWIWMYDCVSLEGLLLVSEQAVNFGGAFSGVRTQPHFDVFPQGVFGLGCDSFLGG